MSLENAFAPWTGRYLQKLSKGRSAAQRIIPLSYLQVKVKFEASMNKFGLLDPSLYRLRHGGASEDVSRRHRRLDQVKKRGRWHTDASLRRYETDIRLQAVEGCLSAELLTRSTVIAQNLEHHFTRWRLK